MSPAGEQSSTLSALQRESGGLTARPVTGSTASLIAAGGMNARCDSSPSFHTIPPMLI
ncbi:MAG: hypothetical protein VB035_04280 [Candidatus Fimivivens sp.]|nr:hypothetical protein [Candidatus Fimivivens sp.]